MCNGYKLLRLTEVQRATAECRLTVCVRKVLSWCMQFQLYLLGFKVQIVLYSASYHLCFFLITNNHISLSPPLPTNVALVLSYYLQLFSPIYYVSCHCMIVNIINSSRGGDVTVSGRSGLQRFTITRCHASYHVSLSTTVKYCCIHVYVYIYYVECLHARR